MPSFYEFIPQNLVGKLIGRRMSIEGIQSEMNKATKDDQEWSQQEVSRHITLEQIHLHPLFLLKLVEGINNDTILSCLVALNHLFLQ
ncbi:hypothetical protein NQ317_014992 [Molorchus minor]|uniref:Uncharacterized protein n=1 Tax=Molorchus minor TaxID=1323400 RepID=A0ABQ9J4Y5_9CUCU|nr:hypothetical protein NQ317_014992 [Molorchus minor]